MLATRLPRLSRCSGTSSGAKIGDREPSAAAENVVAGKPQPSDVPKPCLGGKVKLTTVNVQTPSRAQASAGSGSPHRGVDLTKILKPYYMESDSDSERADRRSLTPKKLLEKFNPLPSAHVQKKIDFFFLPYNKELNTSKCMRFDTDEKQDWLEKLNCMSGQAAFSFEEKATIHGLIRQIEADKFPFESTKTSESHGNWDKIYEFVCKFDHKRRALLLDQFELVKDHIVPVSG